MSLGGPDSHGDKGMKACEDVRHVRIAGMAIAKTRGRPTDYRAHFAKQAFTVTSRFGAIDTDLCELFSVSVQTLNTWKQQHPAFLESIKDGKSLYDARVEKALFERAIGLERLEIVRRVVNGEVVSAETVKQYPPDTRACMFWLKNRQPERWRNQPVSQIESHAKTHLSIEAALAKVYGDSFKSTSEKPENNNGSASCRNALV